MKAHSGMRPQDIVVLCKLLSLKDSPEWRHIDLARELGLSQSEITESLERSRIAGLVDPSKRKPIKTTLLDFLLHGLKYVFPTEPGKICRGIPTAHSAKPLKGKIVSGEDVYVWPSEDGNVRGQEIKPLFKSVPYAVQKDQTLYELLALIDAIRVGKTREQKLAMEELKTRLKGQ